MIILKQHRIYRADLRANAGVLYIFGDNLERAGLGGQAKEMRGEPNAFGIVTKRLASHIYPESYFFDEQEDVLHFIKNDFERLKNLLIRVAYSTVVVPLDGIGTGLAKLEEFAPKTLDFIDEQLQNLRYINQI